MTKWILVLLLIAYFVHLYWKDCTDTIDWRSRTFQVRDTYCSWEEYKSLMDTLEPDEAARASRAMMAVKIPDGFSNYSDYSDFFVELSFPGYGSSSFGSIESDLGDVYKMYGVELPNESASRNALFKLTTGSIDIDGPMEKVLEFIDDDEKWVGFDDYSWLDVDIAIKNNQLIYYLSDGTIVQDITLKSTDVE